MVSVKMKPKEKIYVCLDCDSEFRHFKITDNHFEITDNISISDQIKIQTITCPACGSIIKSYKTKKIPTAWGYFTDHNWLVMTIAFVINIPLFYGIFAPFYVPSLLPILKTVIISLVVYSLAYLPIYLHCREKYKIGKNVIKEGLTVKYPQIASVMKNKSIDLDKFVEDFKGILNLEKEMNSIDKPTVSDFCENCGVKNQT